MTFYVFETLHTFSRTRFASHVTNIYVELNNLFSNLSGVISVRRTRKMSVCLFNCRRTQFSLRRVMSELPMRGMRAHRGVKV